MSVNQATTVTIWLSLDEVRQLLRDGRVSQTDVNRDTNVVYLNFVDRVTAKELADYLEKLAELEREIYG